jgi:hypothetical protein
VICHLRGKVLDSYLYAIILAAAILVGLILTFALKRRGRRAKARPVRNLSPRSTSTVFHEVHKTAVVTPSVGSEDSLVLTLRQNLLLKALGNASVVERLIAFERTKNPAGDQVQWLDAAIRRWEHDNDRR